MEVEHLYIPHQLRMKEWDFRYLFGLCNNAGVPLYFYYQKNFDKYQTCRWLFYIPYSQIPTCCSRDHISVCAVNIKINSLISLNLSFKNCIQLAWKSSKNVSECTRKSILIYLHFKLHTRFKYTYRDFSCPKQVFRRLFSHQLIVLSRQD